MAAMDTAHGLSQKQLYDVTAWFMNVSTSVVIVFVNKVGFLLGDHIISQAASQTLEIEERLFCSGWRGREDPEGMQGIRIAAGASRERSSVWRRRRCALRVAHAAKTPPSTSTPPPSAPTHPPHTHDAITGPDRPAARSQVHVW